MTVPSYGAVPLAKTFLLLRGLSFIAMIAIVGLTANFVSEIVNANIDPPSEIVGTLIISCIATLYCIITIPFFYAGANITLILMASMDGALLLAFVIVSVVLGRPLSFLNCMIFNNTDAAGNAETASAFTQALEHNLNKSGNKLGFSDWAEGTQTNCFETKAIWGLSIALCILFFCSTVILPTLWFKARRLYRPGKKSSV